MNKILIVGHPASGLERVEELLCRCGMKKPNPSRRDGLSAHEITDAICKGMRAPNVDDIPTSKAFSQIKPGSIWDGLVLDLMLGNLEQELWGWADNQALLLMEYFAEVDQQLTFVLVYDEPRSVVTRPADATDGKVAGNEYEKRLDHWASYNSELLHFFLRHRSRSILVHVNAVQHAAEQYLAMLQARLGAPLQAPDIEVGSANAQEEAINLLTEKNLGLVSVESTLNAVFSLSGLPNYDAAGSFLAREAESYLVESFLVEHPTSRQIYEELQASSSLPFDFDQSPQASAEEAWKAFLKQRWFIGQLLAKMHGSHTALTEQNQKVVEHRDRLQIELASIESDLKDRITIIDRLGEALRQRTESAAVLEHNLKQRSAAIEKLEHDLNGKSAKIGELEASLKDRSATAEKLEEEIRQRTASAAQLEENLKERSTAIEKLEHDLNGKSARIGELEASLKDRSATAEKLEEELRQRTASAAQLEENLKERSTAIEKLEHDLNGKSAKIGELEADIKDRSATAEKLIENIDVQSTAISDLEAALTSKEQQNQLLEVSLQVSEEKNSKLLDEMLDSRHQAELKERQWQNDLRSFELKTNDCNNDLKNKSTEIELLQSNLQMVADQNLQLMAQLQAVMQGVESKTLEIERMRYENQELQNLADRERRRNDILVRQLELSQEEVERVYLENRQLQQPPPQPPAPTGAAERVKTHLSYRIGSVMVQRSKTITGFFGLPFSVVSEIKNFKREKSQSERNKLPPLHEYADTHLAEKVKNQLSYRLGHIVVCNAKNPLRWLYMPFGLVHQIVTFNKDKSHIK